MIISDLSISKIHEGLKKKEFSAIELCQAFLKEIKEKDKEIHSYLSINEEGALSQAQVVDKMIAEGKDLPLLAGVPAAIKDNMLIEGLKCTAASKILENYVAPYDATVVKKLKEMGVVFLGKTNLDEFAMGSSTENSAFGPTKNPHDLTRVPGGSSGGSAAAVAGNMAVFSLGSDTGGSIRLPASFCGVVGLKPTYGRVSRNGLMAFASSLDQIGPFAKTVEDCQIVFDTIKGKDALDSTSVELNSPDGYNKKKDLNGLKIGVPKEYFSKGLDPEIEKVLREAIKKYEQAGCKIVEISLPNSGAGLAVYYVVNPSEASANLAKYDGIKYGLSDQSGENLLDVYLKSRAKGFGVEVRRRIMIGTYALSSGYYDAYYLKAQKVRTMIKNDFDKAFKEVDAIFSPVSPSLPFKIGEKIEDPLAMYLADVYTVSVNLAGLPAISLPVGKIGNLPVGLQIIGRPFEEDNIFEIAKFIEKSLK